MGSIIAMASQEVKNYVVCSLASMQQGGQLVYTSILLVVCTATYM